jgi:hypothetical protein
LVQPTFEVVTIITVFVISIILALYLIILRKNGWLGGNSDFYRCPNQKCKGIFQKPIELKDLSETPPRVYPACPECGVNIESLLPSRIEKKSKIKVTTFFHRPKMNHTEKKVETGKVKDSIQSKHPDYKPIEEVPSKRHLESERTAKGTNDSECGQYFGYLSQRDKEEEIPEKCFECSKITDCMLSNFNSENGIKEIKKWYPNKA